MSFGWFCFILGFGLMMLIAGSRSVSNPATRVLKPSNQDCSNDKEAAQAKGNPSPHFESSVVFLPSKSESGMRAGLFRTLRFRNFTVVQNDETALIRQRITGKLLAVRLV
jgi:hypothetical protein